MGVCGFFTLVTQLVLLPPTSCPNLALGETPRDCPWASQARSIIAAVDQGSSVENALQQWTPAILKSLASDMRTPSRFELWGESINRDANTGTTIVDARILRALLSKAGRALRGEVAHAGVQHTYGYLLSILKTPYGYKRARWVEPTLEKGFGLPDGTLGAAPLHGTLLGNATFFLASIALRDSELAQRKVHTDKQVDKSLLAFDFKRLSIHRLIERTQVKNAALEWRIDLVAFVTPQGEYTHLLLYSVQDSRAAHPTLLTAFAVTQAYANNLMQPAQPATNTPMRSRYNAFVLGVDEP